jgi:hypothetical protein
MTQVTYTGISSVYLSSLCLSRHISVIFLYCVLLVPGLHKSLYSWNCGKSIGKFALIDDGIYW